MKAAVNKCYTDTYHKQVHRNYVKKQKMMISRKVVNKMRKCDQKMSQFSVLPVAISPKDTQVK